MLGTAARMALVAAFAFLLISFLQRTDVIGAAPLSATPSDCRVVSEDETGTRFSGAGFEDVVYVNASTAITCAFNLGDVLHGRFDNEGL